MNREQIFDTLKAMRSRFDDGFSVADRRMIEHLYEEILSRHVRKSGCADCYRDAYIELYNFIKNTTDMSNSNYVLKPGVIIHPKGDSKFYANASITDEVAEAYLAEFPKAISKFKSYPSDYLARVEARISGSAVEDSATELAEAQAEIEALKAQLAAAQAEKETETATEESESEDSGEEEVETVTTKKTRKKKTTETTETVEE